MDETGLYWKKMPDRTYISKEEKTIPGFKATKDRLTLLLGGNASGDLKLKPLLVYLSENPRALKNIAKASLPIVWKSNPKAWVTQAIFQEWFYNHFIPEVEKYCRSKSLPFNVLLVLDNAPGHPPYLDDFHPNVKVVYMLFQHNLHHTAYGPGSHRIIQEILFKAHFLPSTESNRWF